MDIFKENLHNFSKFFSYKLCFQNYCTLLIEVDLKKEQLKLHRSLLGVKGGGTKNSPLTSTLPNIKTVTVKINILDKVRQTQQILLENVHKNIIKYCPFVSKTLGGAEKNPVRSSISDRCYFYAKYDKNYSYRACFLMLIWEQNIPIARSRCFL